MITVLLNLEMQYWYIKQYFARRFISFRQNYRHRQLRTSVILLSDQLMTLTVTVSFPSSDIGDS